MTLKNYEKKLLSELLKQEREQREDEEFFGCIFWIVVIVAIALLMGGCAPTVRPVVIYSSQASWDGNKQDSGLIGLDAQKNAILTTHARDRYNELMDAYGKRFSPPAKAGDGITATATNTFLLDAQHFAYFAKAERIRKSEKP